MSVEDLKSRSDLSLDEILLLMEDETDVKMYQKLLYFKFQAMGHDKVESYGLASVKRSTAYYLDDLWAEGGYNALLRKPGQGRKPKLTDEQIKELGDILESKDAWLVNDVLKLIKDKWGEEYSYNGIQNLLNTHFDITFDNYYAVLREKKKNVDNIVQNFDNITQDEKAEIELIINYIKDEKHFNVMKKLFYLLFKKLGFSTDVISYFVSVTPGTGNNWLKRWMKEGYEGLLHKKGQGRKPKLSEEDWETVKKKLSQRDDWLTWEIAGFIKKDFNVTLSESRLSRLLRLKLEAKFSKPYPQSYKQSPYYKSTFHLNLYNKLKKYKLKYNEKTNTIINLETGEPFLIFSFDESSQQFTSNTVRVWSLTKPRMIKNTGKYKTNAAGFYSLTSDGNDDLVFLENSKKESISQTLKSLRKKNPKGVILLLIDNFPSHRSHLVKESAKKINIDLNYLPNASPQVQPVEKIWHGTKRAISSFKIDNIENYQNLTKEESTEILKDTMEKSFYEQAPSKSKWNYVLNNFIKPIIKILNPKENTDWEVQKICSK